MSQTSYEGEDFHMELYNEEDNETHFEESSGHSYRDERDYNWLGYRTFEALGPQADKIWTFYYKLFGGWEVWAQLELAHALTKTVETTSQLAAAALPLEPVSLEFTREEDYPYYNLRSDFTIRVSNNDSHERIYVELKCRSSNEANTGFVYRVKKDIEKVKSLDLESSNTEEQILAIWVMAISVNEHGDEDLDAKMHDLASNMQIQWEVIDLSGDGRIKIWTFCHFIVGYRYGASLLTYSKQAQLRSLGSAYLRQRPATYGELFPAARSSVEE